MPPLRLARPLFVLVVLVGATAVWAQATARVVAAPSLTLVLEPVTEGLGKAVYATSARDGSGRLFVVQLDGLVLVIQDGVVRERPFLNLSHRVTALEGEQGMYSLAFHPDYAANGRLFVSYTERESGRLVVAEHRVSGDPNVVDALASELILLQIAPDEPFHHGGQLTFGPDGMLYVGVGDGIRSVEKLTRTPWVAQDLASLRGKVLRLDVDCRTPCGDAPYATPANNPFVGRSDARGEVFALGFRNPWKFSFDRLDGSLLLGDVSNDRWEEVNRVTSGSNHGWPIREGLECLLLPDGARLEPDCETLPLTPPLALYGHPQVDPQGGNAITGGYVFRGDSSSPLYGRYLFADWVSGRIWSLDIDGADRLELLLDITANISSFVEDDAGNLYLLTIEGVLYRLDAVARSP